MADSRPNQKGRSPGAPDKQSPVRLRPTSRALQLPEGRARRPHRSAGPPFAIESDLSSNMVVRDQELDAIIRLLGGALDDVLSGTGRE
jgi:hypothetical protein